MAGSVEEWVTGTVAHLLAVSEDEVIPQAHLIDDLGADSLDVVELIMALEGEYGLEISDEDAEQIRTVQDVTDYVKHKKEGGD